jgi:hypothetical protein
VGDADGEVSFYGNYTNVDAPLITSVLLQTDTGFTAYPLVDPVIVADTDGAGFVPADAPLQVDEANAGLPTANLQMLPISAGVILTPIGNNVDPTVTLPATLQVGPRGTVRVPVNIDDAHPAGSLGLSAAHLALTYDPSVFSVSAADVHLGSVLAAGSGWTLVPTINPVTGQIVIALSSTTPIGEAIGGSLVTIDFHQVGYGEPSGVSRRVSGPGMIELVASVNPTGQQLVTTELEDPVGTFTLTPAPSNGFDPRIDSLVTLTALPAAAVVSTAVSGPVEFQVAANNTGDASAATSTVSFVRGMDTMLAAVPEVQDLVAGPSPTADTATGHVSMAIVPVAAAVVAASSSSPMAAPFIGLVFQVANMPVVNVQGSASLSSMYLDPVFQALVRRPDPSDATLATSFQDAWVSNTLTHDLQRPALDRYFADMTDDAGRWDADE